VLLSPAIANAPNVMGKFTKARGNNYICEILKICLKNDKTGLYKTEQ
jgi:hypothetical protein